MCVCGFLFFRNWRVGSEDSCPCCCRFSVCVCVLFFVFGDYQSGQRLPGVWVEKSGLGWKKRSLPGICSASHVTWTMCWLLRGCEHRTHVYLSCYLLRSRQNHQICEKAENIYFTVRCNTHTQYTESEQKCVYMNPSWRICWLFREKYSGQFWGCAASDR